MFCTTFRLRHLYAVAIEQRGEVGAVPCQTLHGGVYDRRQGRGEELVVTPGVGAAGRHPRERAGASCL